MGVRGGVSCRPHGALPNTDMSDFEEHSIRLCILDHPILSGIYFWVMVSRRSISLDTVAVSCY